MTSLHGPEPLIDALLAKLQGGLAERLAQINAEATDNIVLSTPQAADYYIAPIDQLPVAPAIIAAAGPAQWAEEGAHAFITSYDVTIYVLEEDPDRQVLARKLQRQVRAIIETVWDDEPREALANPDGGQSLVFRIRPRTTVPGRVFEPDSGDSWRAFYLVIFQASMFEGD
jgi:hypothetical protein